MNCEYKCCRHHDDAPCKDFGGHFYHEDCYKERQDLLLMLDLWKKNINHNVNYGDFRNKVYALLETNSSDYLLYCLEYVLDNKKTLRYPAGLKYYVNDPRIKKAYENSVLREKVKKYDFSAHKTGSEQSFSIKKQENGFGSILK